jgi:iron(III) transport system ATP-binding protein
MIDLKDIEVRYGEFVALKGISLEVEEGEFFTFLGPSGCGKTTTLRTIAGFIKPCRGRILENGVDITDTPVEKRNIGMVFQNYALFPTMSIFENIAFGLRVRRLARSEIVERVNEMAAKVELGADQLDKKVSELSGGQQQRVAIARALVNSPQILCLDEPLSNLDAKLRVQLRNELKEMQSRLGITAIYVTHDQEEALTLSDRIAVFNNGAIEQVASPEEIYNRSKTEFVCNFIGNVDLLSDEAIREISRQAGRRFEGGGRNYIRPECVHINAPSRDGLYTTGARIVKREYYGIYTKYYLDMNGSRVRSIEKSDDRKPYSVGDSVTISIDASRIMSY